MNWKKKTVLVTGVAGFLGGWVSKSLLEKGARVVGTAFSKNPSNLRLHGIEGTVEVLEADITVPAEVRRAFESAKPDFCFHLAAVSIPGVAQSAPAQALLVNVGGSLNVLRECAERHVKTFLASTVSVYGKQAIVNEQSPIQPVDAYGFSKEKMEEIALFLASANPFPLVIARSTNLYGPVDSNETVRLVPRNVLALLRGQRIRNTEGLERDFLFVKDAVDAFISMAENADSLSGKVFNVSYGKSFLGTDIALAIGQLMQKKPVSLQPLSRHRVENSALMRRLDWKPRHSIVEGLQKTIDWYQKQSP